MNLTLVGAQVVVVLAATFECYEPEIMSKKDTHKWGSVGFFLLKSQEKHRNPNMRVNLYTDTYDVS